MTFPTRKLGNDNVSAIGFGAMVLSAFYGVTEPDEERFKVGIDHGCSPSLRQTPAWHY